MKSRKRKSTSRLTAFLLFLSLLLSVFAVFPSSVYAVGTENDAEPVATEQPDLAQEDLPLQEPIDSTIETEFENPAENTASTASVTSTPVVSNTENTSIVPAKGVDMTLGQYQNVRVRTTLSNVTNVSASVDNASILSIQAMTNFNGSDRFFKVTAKQVGIATMTATVTCSNNTTEVVTIEFYVTMSDGIYAIKSCATHLPTSMGDYYLRAEDLDESIPYVYASTNTYGDMTNNIYRYWRVEYAGNGEYKIKPLVDDTTALTALGQWVTVDDDSDSVLKRWVIRYRPGGYEIITSLGLQEGEGMVLSTSTVLNGQYSSTQYYYYAEPTLVEVQNMAFERWQFVSADVSGAYFKDDTTKRIYETVSVETHLNDGPVTLPDLGYSPVVFGYDDSMWCWWHNVADIAEIDLNTGVITPKCPGMTTLYICIIENNTYIPFNLLVTCEGTYFLRNLQNNTYADIRNGSMVNNNLVQQQTFDGANTQKWVFTHVENEIYTIRSAQNINYYLGVAGNSTNSGAKVVLRTGTVTNGMKWRIVVGEEGYKLVSCLSTARVLKATDSTVASDLVSGSYTGDTDYKDEWYIVLPSDEIQLEAQKETKWCWAACARMASTKYMHSPISQESAAVYIKSGIKTNNPTDAQIEAANTSANVQKTAQAVEYILGSSGNTYYNFGAVYDDVTLNGLLDAGNIVVALRGTYNESGTRTGGHYIVIYDYYWDSDLEMDLYKIHDPWSVGSGKSYIRSYFWIRNGSNHVASTDVRDYRVWDGIVVFRIGSYTQTVRFNETE